jgi:serine phosphatase RsbU (regulator of sigma subunit)/DNA-binding transcriptional regulator YhcF (GntR family)
MLLNLTDLSAEPLHSQISRQVLEKILNGDLSDGAELMPARTVAREQHVSVNCVERAYEELVRDGLVISKNGQGFFVAPLTPEQKQAIARHRLLGAKSSLNVLEAFSQQLIAVFDPQKLCAIFAENLQSHLQTKQVSFVFRDDRTGDYALLPSEAFPEKIKINRHDDLLRTLRQLKHPLRIGAHQPQVESSALFKELLRRDVVMALPLLEGNKLLGLIALSGKISGAGYSVEDQRLIMVLANQFVTALTTARFYVEAVQMRQMEEELLLAQQIQAGLLPKALPDDEHLQLAAYSESSRTVGGDFYDYLPIDEQRCGLVIADACGKGMPAAMLISQLQAILKNEAGNGQSLRQTMRNLNQHVKRYTSAKNFATLFYGVFDQRTGILEFANAGHNYPILARQNGAVELLKTTGPALGLHPDWNYATAKIKIGAGEALLLYTDGVNETMNCVEEQYGEERLQEVLSQNRARSATKILQASIEDLNAFHQSEVLQDDRTIMVFKVIAH